MTTQNTVKCPTCDKQAIWNPDNVFRPFCSERCKLIDLGEWASETRTLPGEPVDPNFVFQNNDDLY